MNPSNDEVVLSNTSLCAIVRDEIMNCAGGIGDFIESTVPFVEEAIIVDGLSKDGTREILADAEKKYANLSVFDRQFDTYPGQRNFSLRQSTKEYVLVLDADELLTRHDFGRLRNRMQEEPAWGYRLEFLEHRPKDLVGEVVPGNALRLFRNTTAVKYRNNPMEYLYLNGVRPEIDNAGVIVVDAGVKIKHFVPRPHLYEYKGTHWYAGIVVNGLASEIGPSDVPESRHWKAYNPIRDLYRYL